MEWLKKLVHKVLDYFNLGHLYQDGSTSEESALMLHSEAVDLSIPKDIHFIWLGSCLSEKHQANILGWININPDYKIHLWIDSATIWLETVKQDLQNITKFCENNRVLLHDIAIMPEFVSFIVQPWYNDWVNGVDKNLAFASDGLRLQILALFGGVYADTDVVCKKPLGQLQSKYGFIGLSENHLKYPKITDIWFIAAVPKNDIVLQCLQKVELYYKAFMLNGHTYQELHKRFNTLVSSAAHIADLKHVEKQRAIMNSAYDSFRFKRSATQGQKTRCVGGRLLIEHLNIMLRQGCGVDFSKILFISDGVLEDQKDHSWHAIHNPTVGLRGVAIDGSEVEIILDSKRKNFAVREDVLKNESARQLEMHGKVDQKLVNVLEVNRLGYIIRKARNASINMY